MKFTNNIDNYANLKSLMSLNDSILEVAKGAIKNKNNEIVFKMMDTLGERPELWFSYLSVNNILIHTNTYRPPYSTKTSQSPNT